MKMRLRPGSPVRRHAGGSARLAIALVTALAALSLSAASCAKGTTGEVPDAGRGGGGGGGGGGDGASGCSTCDTDGDGVTDDKDQCAGTPSGQTVNAVGCADSQLTPKLEATFPPYGLAWTPTGSLGRAGGLTWTYTGINRGDLFHIYWVICDDPATPCGLSLDGPIDNPAEKWIIDTASSDFSNGKAVFTNTTSVLLAADGGTPPLSGRLTVTIVDDANAPIPFAGVSDLGITAQSGNYGAEIKGTGFKVVALMEVKDSTSAWTPYLDYYDAAATPDTGDAGGNATVSFGGSFYDK